MATALEVADIFRSGAPPNALGIAGVACASLSLRQTAQNERAPKRLKRAFCSSSSEL